MMHSKWLAATLSTLMVSAFVTAESQRTVFTRENSLPDWEQVEIGARVAYREVSTFFGDSDATAAAPYVRYGLTKDISLELLIPFLDINFPGGDSESGLGDIEATVQLRAFEDLFGSPYFIPHFTVIAPTGDDDKGLGAGETAFVAGISYGDDMYEFISWVWDLSYRINPDYDNQLLLSASVIWNVSEKFAFLAEGRFIDTSDVDPDENTVLGLGGMVYDFSDALQMGVHVGTGFTDDTDAIGQFRLSYSF